MTESNDPIATVKISLLGKDGIGKEEIVAKYCQSEFVEDYDKNLGIKFIERKITVSNTPVNIVIWSISNEGLKNYMDMIKICSEGAHAILLVFDLTSIESLTFIEDLYKNVHECNDSAKYFVVGTKFDLYFELSDQEKLTITEKAKKFAKDIGANGLVYCSDVKSINIKKLFQILIGSVFGLTPKIEQIDDYTKPIITYDIKKE